MLVPAITPHSICAHDRQGVFASRTPGEIRMTTVIADSRRNDLIANCKTPVHGCVGAGCGTWCTGSSWAPLPRLMVSQLAQSSSAPRPRMFVPALKPHNVLHQEREAPQPAHRSGRICTTVGLSLNASYKQPFSAANAVESGAQKLCANQSSGEHSHA